MFIVVIYKEGGQYKVKPSRSKAHRGESVWFVGPIDYEITFEEKVLDGLEPGESHRSGAGILLDKAVNRNAESNYALEIDSATVRGRIIVRPPNIFSFFQVLLALLVGVAVGIAGTFLVS